MISLVLDTNVVASALLWGGKPRLLLQAGQTGIVKLFTSTALLDELADILPRDKFQKKITASGFSADWLIDSYAELSALVQPVHIGRIVSDKDDDVVVATAIAAKADYIITGDSALIELGTYENGRIITVNEAMRLIAAADTR